MPLLHRVGHRTRHGRGRSDYRRFLAGYLGAGHGRRALDDPFRRKGGSAQRDVVGPFPVRVQQRCPGEVDLREEPLALGRILAGTELRQVDRNAIRRTGNRAAVAFQRTQPQEPIVVDRPLGARDAHPGLIRIELAHRLASRFREVR